MTNSQLETGTSRLTYTRRRCTTSKSSTTDLTSWAGQTFSPIQNDREVQETAKYPVQEQAASQSQLIRSYMQERDSDGSCSAENSRVTQRSSEGCRGERVSQKHQQPDNDSHNGSEMKKIETYTTASKKFESTEKHDIGDSNTQQNARD